MPVSIHAPIWGATLPGRLYISDTHIVSIHAPVWGATSAGGVRRNATCFNPRARMGRDRSLSEWQQHDYCFNPRARMGRDNRQTAHIRVYVVSIHAPVWGATSGNCAPHRSQVFQSTRPYGARRPAFLIHALQPCFNPRARMGRDGLLRHVLRVDGVSIHAPVWGAT